MKSRRIFGLISAFIMSIMSIYGILSDSNGIKKIIINILELYPIVKCIAYVLIILFSVLTILALIYDLYIENHKHRLKYGSEKFYAFFKKWYEKEGKLSIICEDLNWIVSEDSKKTQILEALNSKAKNGNLDVFINKSSNQKWEAKLKEAGANVYNAPKNLVVSYSFSCISVLNNNSKVIVREKAKDSSGYITFVEVDNKYVTPLLNSFLEDIKNRKDIKYAK